jgi:membrane fusion protein, multidrug efflux system
VVTLSYELGNIKLIPFSGYRCYQIPQLKHLFKRELLPPLPFMRAIYFIPLTSLLFLPSCGKKQQAGMPQMGPAAVSFLPVSTETVTITRDLPGRIEPYRVAEVRARASGILMERSYKEGTDVKEGQLLFKIDPAPLQAVRDSAAASLVRAQASLYQADLVFNRYKSLIGTNAISRQDLDNADSSQRIAAAEVTQAEAALKTADLNLSYTTVTAPISGRVGKAEVTEGALVGQSEVTKLATIQQLDTVYFDFTQSSTDLADLKRALKSGQATAPDQSEGGVTLLLDDGSEYPLKGKILFSEASVDETTGMVSLRAEIPNPDHVLLPGMFVRGRVVQLVKENAVTVPQRAVIRQQGGVGTVMVVDEKNTAQVRMIQTQEVVGDKWVVSKGLKPGEKVIIEGLMMTMPGAPVIPEPFVQKAESAPAATPNKG